MNRLFSFLLLSIMILSGCTGTKHLPPEKAFVEKTVVRLEHPGKVRKRRQLVNSLESKAAPEVNSKFIGLFRFKLWLHEQVRQPKKDKGFRHWLKYKVGEPPVFYDKTQCERSTLKMEKYLEDNGFFRSQVGVDTLEKKKHTQVIYTVANERQYKVRNVILPEGDDEVRQIVRRHKGKLRIDPCDPYRVEVLRSQRDEFAALVRNEGYYDFNREYIYYYIDSTIGDHLLDVYFRVREPVNRTDHLKYFIDDVTVYPTYAIDDTVSGRSLDTIRGAGHTILQYTTFLKTKPLLMNLRLRQGEAFSQRNHANTVNRFLDMGIFQYVNIRYFKNENDSLDVTMQLTPGKTQDVSAEINLNTATGNFLGIGGGVSYAHQNLFKGGELFNISTTVNTETQFNSGNSFINTLEIIARAELGFPRFMLLFKKNYTIDLPYVPRTRIALTETFQRRVQYYTLNSVVLDFTYDWRKNKKVHHTLTPISVNNINLFSTTDEFQQILDENPVLRSSFEDVFIIGNSYSLVYTGASSNDRTRYGYLRTHIENAGNLIHLVNSASNPNQEPYKIFNRPYSNYIKTDLDARYYLQFSERSSLASRIIAGIAVPMGNSEVIPYVKQFFIGGATSIRAYRLRTLGPGSFLNEEQESVEFFPDQTGDIKLEVNVEYRYTIRNFLKGALFVDAGNIWLLNEDPQRPGAEFESSRFYSEIAVGAGLGLRFDFDFLVIRTDVATPLRKPSLPEGDRWTFDKFDFGNRDWRRDNVIWNIAIGYPF